MREDVKIRSLFLAATVVSRFKRTRRRREKEELFKEAEQPSFNQEQLNETGICEDKKDDGLVCSANLSPDQIRRGIALAAESPAGNGCRVFIHEGAVQLSSGGSSQARYMFLFNDLLLIAKSKSSTSYKLKNKLRVCELWLATCVDEVTEATVAQDTSFVIGWPTNNFVATFNSSEDKDLWWSALKKSINEQRELQHPKAITLKVINRDTDQSTLCTKSLPINIDDDARAVVRRALEEFEIQTEDPEEYQLWVFSEKENGAYPLIGHEMPFAIKMNHIKEAFSDIQEISCSPEILSRAAQDPMSPEAKCQFILKRRRKAGARIGIDFTNTQKKWKSPIKKSPIINWGMGKKSPRTNSPSDLSPQGRLFGVPLVQIATEDGQLPEPIQSILSNLFRKGPMTVGIFRKSALQRSAKQIRQTLEDGKDVDFNEKGAVLLASVLKDFLRSMPDCLFGCEFFDELLSTKSADDSGQRAEEMKKILNKLPKANQELLKRVFCVLFYVAKFSSKNNMNSSNLAVCISPSVLWSSMKMKLPLSSCTADDFNPGTELVQFTIDNFTTIFGEEALSVLGNESEIQLDLEDPDSNSDLSGDQMSPPPINDTDVNEDVNQNNCINGLVYKSDQLEVIENLINSKSNPSSPVTNRRMLSSEIGQIATDDPKSTENISSSLKRRSLNRTLSDNGINKNFIRKQRARSVLSSSITTAELIPHRDISKSSPQGDMSPPSETGNKIRVMSFSSNEHSAMSPTSPTASRDYSHFISYHQRPRPAPSYEEATQTLRRDRDNTRNSNSRRSRSFHVSSRCAESVTSSENRKAFATESIGQAHVSKSSDTSPGTQRSTPAIFFSSDEIRSYCLSGYHGKPRGLRLPDSEYKDVSSRRSRSFTSGNSDSETDPSVIPNTHTLPETDNSQHDLNNEHSKDIDKSLQQDCNSQNLEHPVSPFSTIEVHKRTVLKRQNVSGLSYIEEMEHRQLLQRRKALLELDLKKYGTVFKIGSSEPKGDSDTMNRSFNVSTGNPKVYADEPLSVSLDSAAFRRFKVHSKASKAFSMPPTSLQSRNNGNSQLRSALKHGNFLFEANNEKASSEKHVLAHNIELKSSELFPSEAHGSPPQINCQNNWIVKELSKPQEGRTLRIDKVSRRPRSPTCPSVDTAYFSISREITDESTDDPFDKHHDNNSTSSGRSSMSDDFRDLEALSREDIAKIMLQEESYV